MKQFALIIALLIFTTSIASSQEAYICREIGEVFEYNTFGENGELESKIRNEVIKIVADSVYIQTTISDRDGKPAEPLSNFINKVYVEPNGTVHMYRSQIFFTVMDKVGATIANSALKSETNEEEEQEVDKEKLEAIFEDLEAEENSISIPSRLKIGMKLKDYNMKIKIAFMSIKNYIEDRKVIAKETIYTKYGALECYVIESTEITKAIVMSDKNYMKEWYTPGIGLVKSETYSDRARTKLTNSLILIPGDFI